DGRADPERHRDEVREQHGREREADGVLQLVRQRVEHRDAVVRRHAEVEVEELPPVGGEAGLEEERRDLLAGGVLVLRPVLRPPRLPAPVHLVDAGVGRVGGAAPIAERVVVGVAAAVLLAGHGRVTD
ncbi:MAG: hypothetical protein ACK559_10555, partial [bacterium]